MRLHSPHSRSEPLAVCQTCRGECCRGVAERYNPRRLMSVRVTPTELASMGAVAQAALVSEESGIGRGFYNVRLPCPVLGENGCRLPEPQRPATCRDYLCPAAERAREEGRTDGAQAAEAAGR